MDEIGNVIKIKMANLVKNNIKYVIVSGYVAILFGRSRISEDVDLLVEHISFEKFGTVLK